MTQFVVYLTRNDLTLRNIESQEEVQIDIDQVSGKVLKELKNLGVNPKQDSLVYSRKISVGFASEIYKEFAARKYEPVTQIEPLLLGYQLQDLMKETITDVI